MFEVGKVYTDTYDKILIVGQDDKYTFYSRIEADGSIEDEVSAIDADIETSYLIEVK